MIIFNLSKGQNLTNTKQPKALIAGLSRHLEVYLSLDPKGLSGIEFVVVVVVLKKLFYKKYF